MPRFGVNFITDAYYVIEADDQEQALDFAYEELHNSLVGEFDWDCNEIVDLEDEDD